MAPKVDAKTKSSPVPTAKPAAAAKPFTAAKPAATAKPAAPAKSAATSKPAAKSAAPAKISAASKPASSGGKSASTKAGAKSGKLEADTEGITIAAGKVALLTPAQEAEKEEAEYLEVYGSPSDPWSTLQSAYGGPLSAAECYTKMMKELLEKKDSSGDSLPGHVISKAAIQNALSQSPQSSSQAVAVANAIHTVLSDAGEPSSSQRLILRGVGLEGSILLPAAAAERFVEVDLSGNSITSVDLLAPNSFRSLSVGGNLLKAVPNFKIDLPKLVMLDLSFNDLGQLPDAECWRKISNVRRLGLQNCMLKTIVTDKGECSLAPLANLVALDLSFNLLSKATELVQVTCLQRLAEVDVGCNEMCFQEDYDETLKSLRRKMSTLKKLNEKAVQHTFVGYGIDAVETAARVSATANALGKDNSSCSCVEGNPCLSPDNCSNWKDRFKIAHKARMENYWNKGKNFCDL